MTSGRCHVNSVGDIGTLALDSVSFMSHYLAMQSDERLGIANGVRAELARHRRSQRDAAAILGLPQQSVHKRLAGETPFRAEELAKLAEALGISVSRFFPEAVSR